MIRKVKKRFSSVRMQLVASVFVVIAPALVITYVVNQTWFWRFAPEWLKPFATDVPWASFTIGLLALIASWFGGEHFILRQVRALLQAAHRLAAGDLAARTGLKDTDGELGQLAKTFDSMAESLQQRVKEREEAEKILLNRALQQTVVAALGQFALTNNDLEALGNQAVMLVAQTFEVEYCGFWERLPDGQLLLRAGVGWKQNCVGKTKISGDNRSQIGFTLESGEPVIADGTHEERKFSESPFFAEHAIASGVTIAIPTREKSFGVLGVHTARARKFTPEEVQFLLATATAIGMAADRLNLETLLRQSQKMESVGQLAAGVAHDFNNMLTIIQGHSSSLLAKQDLPNEILGPVQAVYFAAERAASLTRQLLMFSRKNVMQLKPLDLRETVGNITKMLQRLIGENISLQFQPPDELPLVTGDSGMMEQILMNLSVNARDAMPHGGALTLALEDVRIDENYLQMHPEAHVGRCVRLRVTDTGCGMETTTLAHIFEPFFTTKEVGKGTGLGLATVYGIVKQHDGWLEVTSEPGKGTAFDIFIPAENEMAVAVKKEIISTDPIVGGTETILIVEDEPVLRAMARDILQECGYKILEAASGRDALNVWDRRTDEIDLLLTDMVMPEGVSGVDLAERLLVTQPQLKIIFTSGYTANEVSPEILAKTRAQFLQKPYAHIELAKAVRDCLDKNAVAEAAATRV
jgi:signal transduction histidine kinase/HAMP domain-containing protein/ActR/RegA family two-component response regulator